MARTDEAESQSSNGSCKQSSVKAKRGRETLLLSRGAERPGGEEVEEANTDSRDVGHDDPPVHHLKAVEEPCGTVADKGGLGKTFPVRVCSIVRRKNET